MLGLGWIEMLVVGIVALIVIGPKDLPMVMQRIGKFAGQIRRMGMEFQREINKTTGLDEVRNLRQSITEPLRKTTDEIRREFNTMTPSGPKPSGAIKPADPAKESVADEIRAAAGMKPEAPGEPVKAARITSPKPPAKAVPVKESVVARAGLAPVEAKPAKAPRTRKEAMDMAAAEASAKPAAKAPAPAKKSTARKAPAKAANPEAVAAKSPAKPAAKKPAARKKAAAKKPATGGEG